MQDREMYELGLVKYKAGDYKGAILHFEKAIELNPLESTYHEWCGNAYLASSPEGGRTANVLYHCSLLLAPECLHLAAEIQKLKTNIVIPYIQSLKDILKAPGNSSVNSILYSNVAAGYFLFTDEHQKSVNWYLKCDREKIVNNARLSISLCKLKRYEEACKYIAIGINKIPFLQEDDKKYIYELYYARGLYYQGVGDYFEATADFAKANELFPKDAVNLRPKFLIDFAKHEQMLQKAKLGSVQIAQQAMQAYFSKDYETTIALFESLNNLGSPLNANLYIGLSFLQLNRREGAIKHLREFVSANDEIANQPYAATILKELEALAAKEKQVESEKLTWITQAKTNLITDSIRTAIEGAEATTNSPALEAICKHGFINSKKQLRITIALRELIYTSKCIGDEFSSDHRDILIYEMAKVLQPFLTYKAKKKTESKVHFKLKLEKISTDVRFNSAMKEALLSAKNKISLLLPSDKPSPVILTQQNIIAANITMIENQLLASLKDIGANHQGNIELLKYDANRLDTSSLTNSLTRPSDNSKPVSSSTSSYNSPVLMSLPHEVDIPSSEIDNQGKLSLSFAIPYNQLRFGQILGSGGFGQVFKGNWRHNEVAIKKLHAQALSEEVMKEFKQEATIMARLRSPNIVQLYGITLDSTPYCMVMEYMANGSLYSYLHSSKPLTAELQLQIAKDLACGLAFLHEEKILHRDLKSLNVLLDSHMRAKVADFGLSKLKTETASNSKHESVGTLIWMAPELFQRRAKYTPACDIYSYAITIWELVARQLPFADAQGNQALIKQWILEGEREEIPKECSPNLAAIIQQCWHKEANLRPSAARVLEMLREEPAASASATSASIYRANLDSYSPAESTAGYRSNFSQPAALANNTSYRTNIGNSSSVSYWPNSG